MVAGVVLEGVFGLATFISADIRETNNQERIAQFQVLLAWRTITDQEVDSMISGLSSFKGELATISALTGDPEGQLFAKQLTLVLRRAHWDARGVGLMGGFAYTATGIRLSFTGDKKSRDAAAALFTELKSGHFGVTKDVDIDRGPVKRVTIMVGAKPPPSWMERLEIG